MYLTKDKKDNIVVFVKLFGLFFILILSFFLLAKYSKANTFGLDERYKQVKSADNPTVYYLDHNLGKKKAYVSEKSYLAYGNSWSDIKIIDQNVLAQWPDIKLVKAGNENKVYYIKDNKKAWIKSESVFINSGFNWNDIVGIAPQDLETYATVDFNNLFNSSGIVTLSQADVSESDLDSDNKLKVEKSSVCPNGGLVPLNTQGSLVAAYNFSSTNSTVDMKSITIDINGVYDWKAIKGVYAIVNNEISTKHEGVLQNNDRKAIIRFYNNSMSILPGKTKEVKIYIETSDCLECADGSFNVVLAEATSIETTSEIVGSFPIATNSYKIVNGAGALGEVSVERVPLNVNNKEYIIGSTGQELVKVKISETSEEEDLIIKNIIFTDKGSINEKDLSNFVLKNKNGKIVSRASGMNGNSISFNLDDYKISKASSDSFTVLADVVDGYEKTINFNIDSVYAVGNKYGFGLSPNYTYGTSEIIKITREKIGAISKNLVASKNLFANQKGVLLGVFELRNNNQAITLENLNVNFTRSDYAPIIKKPIYMINYNTGEVISVNSLNDDNSDFDFANLKLSKKESLTIAFVSDIPKSAKQGDKYRIDLVSVDYKSNNSSQFEDSLGTLGTELKVSRSNLYLYKNNQFDSVMYIKGQKSVKLASFIIESSYGDNISINSISLSKGNTSGVVNYENGFSNLRVYIGNTKIGIVDRPFTDVYNFGDFVYSLKGGARVQVNVYADVDQDANISETNFVLRNISAKSKNSGIETTVNGLNVQSGTVYFGDEGAALSVLNGGSVTKGEANSLVASFKIENTGDDCLYLKYITIITSNEGFSNSLGYTNLEIRDHDSGRSVANIGKPFAGANRLSMGNSKVLAGEEKVFDVYIDSSEDVLSAQFNMYFSDVEAFGCTTKNKIDLVGDPSSEAKVKVN